MGDLSEDLRFAEDEGVESGGHAEEMGDGVRPRIIVEVRVKVGAGDSAGIFNQGDERVEIFCPRNGVHFEPAAGGEDDEFLQTGATIECVL